MAIVLHSSLEVCKLEIQLRYDAYFRADALRNGYKPPNLSW